MPNPNNLKPFQKGKDERRNVKGQPRKLPALDQLLTDILGDSGTGKSEAAQIIAAMVKKAKRGDVKAATLLLERAYGKVADKLHLSGNVALVDEPVTFE